MQINIARESEFIKDGVLIFELDFAYARPSFEYPSLIEYIIKYFSSVENKEITCLTMDAAWAIVSYFTKRGMDISIHYTYRAVCGDNVTQVESKVYNKDDVMLFMNLYG